MRTGSASGDAGHRSASGDAGQGVSDAAPRPIDDPSSFAIATDVAGRLTGLSAGAAKALGVTASEVVGRQLAEVADLGVDIGTVVAALLAGPEQAWVGDGLISVGSVGSVGSVTSNPPSPLRLTARLWTTAAGESELLMVGVPAATGGAGVVPAPREQVDWADRDRLHEIILQSAQEGVWVVGLDGMSLFSNAKMAELLGIAHAEMVDRPIWELFDRAALGVVRHHLPSDAPGAADEYELEVTSPQGRRRWLHVTGTPLHDGQGKHVANLAMYSDITNRKHLEQEYARLSLYDSLTSLPNRALFLDRLRQLSVERERTGDEIAVLYCDIDRFGQINRARGHAIGDEVLTAVAERLRTGVRRGDTVARFDGDDFVILCPGADIAQARDLAIELCAAMRPPLELADEKCHVSMSIGVAATPSTSPSELVDAAAMARYDAQQLGRARVEVHNAASRPATDDLLRLRTDLQLALEQNRLTLRYQPVARLRDFSTAGVEALTTWNHPSRGELTASEIAAIAEDGGSMLQLGEWVLRRACSDALSLRDAATADWRLSVNLSTQQLADPGFPNVVRKVLEETGFPVRRLLLEVNETAVVSGSMRASGALRDLRAMGLGIAIDHFGAGSASLAYLRQLPVDTIKIDQSFVAGMTTDNDDLAIVASIVSLAAAVGVQAIADGVEREEQVAALRRLGCPLAQGSFWGSPVALADLPEAIAVIARGYRQPAQQDGRSSGQRRSRRSPAADEAVLARIIALHRSGASLTTIAAALNAENLTTTRGLRWHRSSVARVIAEREISGAPPTT